MNQQQTTFFSRIRSFIKKHKWWTALIVFVFFIVLFIFLGRKKSAPIETVTAGPHDITEEVSVTGNVKPLSDLDLSFRTSGQVASVPVSVGDAVYAGETLASLANADLAAAVEQAQAGLQIASANLASLESGSTPQQVAVSQSQANQAKDSVATAATTLVNAIENAYAKSDDAVRNYTDVMFTNPQTANPILDFQTDFGLEHTIIAERVALEPTLDAWSASTTALTASSDLAAATAQANAALSDVQDFLQNLALAVNNAAANASAAWKSDVSTARTNVSAAATTLASAVTAYQAAVSALSVANDELAVTQAGPTADEVAAAEASVQQAQANVDAAKANLDKSIIRSPIDGVVTNVDANVGETISSGATALSVISYGKYDVEAYVPEADIAKVAVGDTATATLDAYGSNVFFKLSVTKIDPAETIIENVPTYKVTLVFASSSDPRIKSGMTANLDILAGQKSGVLAVPSRSVYTLDAEQYVDLVDPNVPATSTPRAVTTGLRGVDGYVEITSGLSAGDVIVASPNM